ncbi:MAG: hypothetical protein ABSG43_16200 [Solirubrobacteraceae bacterium]
MLTEHEQRAARSVSDYLERPGGDYGELLHRGQMSSPDGVNPEAWRSDIRAQARRVKIRVIASHSRDGAIAFLYRAVGDQEVRDELERAECAPVARHHRASARARARPLAAQRQRERLVL